MEFSKQTATDTPPRREPSELPLGGGGCSEDGLAGELLYDLQDDYRYATDLRCWITRDGPRWVPAPEGVTPYIAACVAYTERPEVAVLKPSTLKMIRRTGQGVYARLTDAKMITPEMVAEYDQLQRLKTPAAQARIAAMMRNKAPIDDGNGVMAVCTADLDTEAGVLWAGGVPVDLARSASGPVWAEDDYVYQDGHREPWAATYPHMLSANYRPDIAVPVPVWDTLTEAIFPDIDEREHALNALAHGLHGYPAPAAILARSATGTGKSLLTSLLADLLGDYAGQVSAATLFGRSGSSQFAFDEMRGARFVVMNEGRKADFAATEAFKAVVNPDPLVNARGRHERHRRLVPARHTLMLTVNPAADLDYSDPAVRRRLIPAGFTGDTEKIAAIASRYGTASAVGRAAWESEAPGVLARMIMRCAWVLEDPANRGTRADAPESVMSRFDAVAMEADPFGRWLRDRTGDGLPTSNDDLFADYRKWCREHGETAMNQTWFGRHMASAGIDRARIGHSGTRGWRLALK